MFSNVVLNIFNNPKNAGRIKKPDGIADCYNYDGTAHVEFSLRIENGIIKFAQFRAQANPYIIAICSTITQMLKDKMVSMVFLDPYSIKTQLGDESDVDIDFCIDCVKMAITDYKEKIEKESKGKKNGNSDEVEEIEEDLPEEDGDEFEEFYVNNKNEESKPEKVQDEEDDDFADFFDDIFEED